MNRSRVFISIYFSDGNIDKRKRRDLTLAFDSSNELYEVCRTLGSTGIKKLIQISSYKELVDKAKAEERTLSNYIKHKLSDALRDEEKNTTS